MSILHLGTDVEQLANRLARNLMQVGRAGDFFAPATIVVPHRSLGQWLKLWLARQQGVAINLRFLYLEAALWEMLLAIDPRKLTPVPELLDGDNYRLLVLAILLENREPDLAYWQNFLNPLAAGTENSTSRGPSRLFCRRIWHLADQLSNLIRDYEYHRQDTLIQHWLKDELGLGPGHANLERAERAIFRAITREPDGKRSLLNKACNRNFKTLPQYAMEVMEYFQAEKKTPSPLPDRTIHLFGLSQMSSLHARTLGWLGRFFDLHLYHFNSLVARFPGRPNRTGMRKFAKEFRNQESGTRNQEPGARSQEAGILAPGSRLLTPESQILPPASWLLDPVLLWGQAAAESLDTMAELLADRSVFTVEKEPAPSRETCEKTSNLFAGKNISVLTRLQDLLHHGSRAQIAASRLPQDRSLQIVACPGRMREVATVYQSILANLQDNKSLRQSDIAVLVTDMDLYRPILQTVFERQPRRLKYNLGDFSAAGVSTFGQGLLGLLDLALDSFCQSRVFEVLLNPCFLARLGVERSQALVWLDWAQTLGIHQGWDQNDKKERGYADSPLFAWQLGLQRLRLGRIMEVKGDDGTEPVPRFGPVIPFADLHSSDPEELDAFCLAVDGLLPRLVDLRRKQGTAAEWIATLEALIRDFLAVPEDRPEEGQVRDRLLEAFHFAIGNLPGTFCPEAAVESRLSLALVREMVLGILEGISGRQGEYLAGGVTISALHPLKPMPFRVVYVLGLGEDLFPGSNQLSGLDLRRLEHCPGDIRPAEYNRYLLLETLLLAREKIYLLYNNLDVQRDQVLHPAVCLQQLRRFLGEQVVQAEFAEVKIPLLGDHEDYLHPSPDRQKEFAFSDVLVQFEEMDRLLAITAARDSARLTLTPQQQAELQSRLEKRRQKFSLTKTAKTSTRPSSLVPTLTLKTLQKYLESPVEEALKYHLRLEDEEDPEMVDDEPFVSDLLTGIRLMKATLNQLVLQGMQGDVDQVLKDWRGRFAQLYQEFMWRGQVPEGPFGKIDCAALVQDLEKRMAGGKSVAGLQKFLQDRPGSTFCGPVLLGESYIPLGARQRFPGLVLPLTRPLPNLPIKEVRLVGWNNLVWRSSQALEILVWCFKGKKPTARKDFFPILLEPWLFFLALKAGTVGHPDSQGWLGDREFRVHVGHQDGIKSITFLPGDTTSDEARYYLAELATDFLDPECFDQLPLEKILKFEELQKAFTLPDDQLGDLPTTYQDIFEDYLLEDQEGWNGGESKLADLIEVRVPPDAFQKVRRRFRRFDQAFPPMGKDEE